MYGRKLHDVINEEIRLCCYFVIVTSEKMTAAQALELYKSRNVSEKLFRGDKSYLDINYQVTYPTYPHSKSFLTLSLRYTAGKKVNPEPPLQEGTEPDASRVGSSILDPPSSRRPLLN